MVLQSGLKCPRERPRIRIVDNDLLNATARHEFGAALATFSTIRDNHGLANPEFYIRGTLALKELDGDPGSKLIVDGLVRLFVHNDGASGQDLNIGSAFNNDVAV
jgi:hypothetical protein